MAEISCALLPKIQLLQAVFRIFRISALPVLPRAQPLGTYTLFHPFSGLLPTSESPHTVLPPFLLQIRGALPSLLPHTVSHCISLPVSSPSGSLCACSSWYGYASSVWLSRSTHGSPWSPCSGIPVPATGRAATPPCCSCNSGSTLARLLLLHPRSGCLCSFQGTKTAPLSFPPPVPHDLPDRFRVVDPLPHGPVAVKGVQLEAGALVLHLFYPGCPVCIQDPFVYFVQVIFLGDRRLPAFMELFRIRKSRHHYFVRQFIAVPPCLSPAVIRYPYLDLCLVRPLLLPVFPLQLYVHAVRLLKQHRHFLFPLYMPFFVILYKRLLFLAHLFAQSLYDAPYPHGADPLSRHLTHLRRTFPVGQFRHPFYQQFCHVRGDEPHAFKFQALIQQIHIMTQAVFLHHLVYCPTVVHLSVHRLYGGLAAPLVAVLLPLPPLHQHPVIPFQKLSGKLSAYFADPEINIFLQLLESYSVIRYH